MNYVRKEIVFSIHFCNEKSIFTLSLWRLYRYLENLVDIHLLDQLRDKIALCGNALTISLKIWMRVWNRTAMKYNVQSSEMEALGEAHILLACRKPFPLVYGLPGLRVSQLQCNFSLSYNKELL